MHAICCFLNIDWKMPLPAVHTFFSGFPPKVRHEMKTLYHPWVCEYVCFSVCSPPWWSLSVQSPPWSWTGINCPVMYARTKYWRIWLGDNNTSQVISLNHLRYKGRTCIYHTVSQGNSTYFTHRGLFTGVGKCYCTWKSDVTWVSVFEKS